MGSSEHAACAPRVHAEDRGLREAAVAAGGTHVALLEATTVDEWHRSLSGTPQGRCHYVSVDDTVRGATASSGGGGRAVGGGVFVSVLERPVTDPTAPIEDAFADASGGTVVVDDPTFVLADSDDPEAAIEDLASAAAAAGAELHVGLPTDVEAAALVSRRFEPADDETARAAAEVGLSYLRATDPTNFGYLRQHWREARRGLEAVEMSYPQAKQVHATLSDPRTTPRTLGAALRALVELGALGVWGDTVAANRYDLTAYDPERVATIGEAIESLAD
ncbi:hypothetical protein HUG10_04160 [Halorarum halophilum]|uniref:Uncharacterized protein n=1 Tax=Halorarum halophilum TaxID=2743090 RepID=A0A7D5GJD3_9EURY|nr:hypothetical protein [Halobaculum halophilum]QLG26784.1 hypothetical protein HUG10_04160 [Halobaculum halophilum]